MPLAGACVAATGTLHEQVARSWLEGAIGAYGKAKQLLRSAPSRSFADQLEAEAFGIGASFDTDDAKARIRAFIEASLRRQREKDKK